MRFSARLEQLSHSGELATLHTDGVAIRIMCLSAHILRIRADFTGEFTEQSYSLATTAWPDRLDHVLGPERTRVQPEQLSATESENEVLITAGSFTLRIDKNPFRIRVYDAEP